MAGRSSADGSSDPTGVRYQDRFDPLTYVDDEPVGIYAGTEVSNDSCWVPERIFLRMAKVALAYELHLLPLMGGVEPVRLSQPMMQTLLDEIAFVAEQLPLDPLVAEHATAMHRYISAVLRRPSEQLLTVDGRR